MKELEIIFTSIYGVIKTVELSDLIDIILIAYLIYKIISLVRETRAIQLVKGILLLGASYFVAHIFELRTMSFLLKNIFQIGIIALIVLFQPELRRVLEKVGRTKVTDLSVFNADTPEKQVEFYKSIIKVLCSGISALAEKKIGALIVMERTTRLGEQIDTGVILDSIISEELLMNIFYPNTPLHDGAVIIREGKILAASCFLPKPQKEDFIASHLGSRHRAAIGISEISDSITIIVSEETGTISATLDGQLTRNYTKESLQTFLEDKLLPKADTNALKKKPFWRIKKNEKKL